MNFSTNPVFIGYILIHYLWKILNHSFFKCFPLHSLSLLLLRLQLNIFYTEWASISWVLCPFKNVFNNFLFCCHLSNVYWPIFKFTEAFLGCVSFTDEPVRDILHLLLCVGGKFISSMPSDIFLLWPFLCWNYPSIQECLQVFPTGACNILITVILNPLSDF